MADAANFDRQMAAQSGAEQELCWYPIPDRRVRVDGLGFFEQEGRWNRLPLSLEPVLQRERPELLELAAHTAGASLHFATGSGQVWVRAKLTSPPYMPHMTPAGQCGFDCYVRGCQETEWKFRGLTKFPIGEDRLECCVAAHLTGNNEICLDLPLYIGVESLEIGLEPGAALWTARPCSGRRSLAVYGTSIDQGGCASRPGMAFPAILSRTLDREVFNLGFSGNGVGMPLLADVICQLPRLGLLILDIQANAGPQRLLRQNLPAFLDRLRELAPELPVAVLSASPQTDTMRYAQMAGHTFEEDELFQQQETERRRQAGDRKLCFVSARELLKTAGTETTVDGIHLNDLGFYLLAEGLVPVLKELLR